MRRPYKPLHGGSHEIREVAEQKLLGKLLQSGNHVFNQFSMIPSTWPFPAFAGCDLFFCSMSRQVSHACKSMMEVEEPLIQIHIVTLTGGPAFWACLMG